MAWVLFSDANSTLCTAKKVNEVFDKAQTKNIDRRNPCVRLLLVCGEEIVGCFYSIFFISGIQLFQVSRSKILKVE